MCENAIHTHGCGWGCMSVFSFFFPAYAWTWAGDDKLYLLGCGTDFQWRYNPVVTEAHFLRYIYIYIYVYIYIIIVTYIYTYTYIIIYFSYHNPAVIEAFSWGVLDCDLAQVWSLSRAPREHIIREHVLRDLAQVWSLSLSLALSHTQNNIGVCSSRSRHRFIANLVRKTTSWARLPVGRSSLSLSLVCIVGLFSLVFLS